MSIGISACWLLTSSLCAATLDKSKRNCPALLYRMYRLESFVFGEMLFPLSPLRQQEVWAAVSGRSRRRDLLYAERKDLGSRGRQDWRRWLGSVLHEVGQLSEDLWQLCHRVTHLLLSGEVNNSHTYIRAAEVKSHSFSSSSLQMARAKQKMHFITFSSLICGQLIYLIAIMGMWVSPSRIAKCCKDITLS